MATFLAPTTRNYLRSRHNGRAFDVTLLFLIVLGVLAGAQELAAVRILRG